MYIGAWQEYNLSKARASRVDEKLRPGIEQALRSTLDPAAAQKAMEAMIPYFEKPTAPAHSRAGQRLHGARKRTIRTLPHIPSALNPSPTVISARERSLHSSSPLSVRSSQSEPIRYSNSPSKATTAKPASEFTDSVHSSPTELPAIKQTPPYTQPAYNSPAMLNILRLERQSKARNQIAALTGWKVNRTASTDTDGESTERHRKMQKESEHDTKLEHVNQMKQLYLSGGSPTVKTTYLPAINGATKDTSPTISKLTPMNLAQHNKSFAKQDPAHDLSKYPAHKEPTLDQFEPEEDGALHTPRVGDIDLNDAAFNLVSKYFQSNTGVSAMEVDYWSENNKSTPSASQNHLLYDVRRDTPSELPAPVSVPATSYNGIGYEDTQHTEEYMGGMDGLLAWTRQLELDLDLT